MHTFLITRRETDWLRENSKAQNSFCKCRGVHHVINFGRISLISLNSSLPMRSFPICARTTITEMTPTEQTSWEPVLFRTPPNFRLWIVGSLFLRAIRHSGLIISPLILLIFQARHKILGCSTAEDKTFSRGTICWLFFYRLSPFEINKISIKHAQS